MIKSNYSVLLMLSVFISSANAMKEKRSETYPTLSQNHPGIQSAPNNRHNGGFFSFSSQEKNSQISDLKREVENKDTEIRILNQSFEFLKNSFVNARRIFLTLTPEIVEPLSNYKNGNDLVELIRFFNTPGQIIAETVPSLYQVIIKDKSSSPEHILCLLSLLEKLTKYKSTHHCLTAFDKFRRILSQNPILSKDCEYLINPILTLIEVENDHTRPTLQLPENEQALLGVFDRYQSTNEGLKIELDRLERIINKQKEENRIQKEKFEKQKEKLEKQKEMIERYNKKIEELKKEVDKLQKNPFSGGKMLIEMQLEIDRSNQLCKKQKQQIERLKNKLCNQKTDNLVISGNRYGLMKAWEFRCFILKIFHLEDNFNLEDYSHLNQNTLLHQNAKSVISFVLDTILFTNSLKKLSERIDSLSSSSDFKQKLIRTTSPFLRKILEKLQSNLSNPIQQFINNDKESFNESNLSNFIQQFINEDKESFNKSNLSNLVQQFINEDKESFNEKYLLYLHRVSAIFLEIEGFSKEVHEYIWDYNRLRYYLKNRSQNEKLISPPSTSTVKLSSIDGLLPEIPVYLE